MSAIAIVGISCQFPSAGDLAAYWELIKRNICAIGKPPSDRTYLIEPLAALGIPAYGGYIDDFNAFDARRFYLSDSKAALMDPQQKLVLSHVCRAIEDAGMSTKELEGSRTGVFIGAMANDMAYLTFGDVANVNADLVTGNGLSMIANRVSYEMDFQGPSMTIDSACSSALVALHYAVRSLQDDECDFAVVAGVNIILSALLQKFYRDAGVGSPDGICKSFSSTADGIGRAEGVGVLLLCSMDRAHVDGKKVYATICGSSVNNGGQSSRFTAPNIKAQVDVLQRAYRVAGVGPSDIAYVEGHGTGTLQGDYMEVNALKQVFAGRNTACPLGSVKSLIGHSEAASGAAGVIKAALMLHHRHIPKSLYADSPTQWLDASSPVQLVGTAVELARQGTYHMGVSAFGLGGTNAHVVLASHG